MEIMKQLISRSFQEDSYANETFLIAHKSTTGRAKVAQIYMLPMLGGERLQHRSYVDVQCEHGAIDIIPSTSKMAPMSRRQRPVFSNSMLVQYSQVLELEENNPTTSNHSRSALDASWPCLTMH
jgi:hypothetical protein